MAVPDDAVERLRSHLAEFGVGEEDELRSLLADAWDGFDGGDESAMAARKIRRLGRVGSLAWTPPVLTFRMERHGGTVLGSTRAEIQEWTVDLDARTATAETVGRRQLRPMRKRLDVAAVAEEIIAAVNERADDPRLKWSKDGGSVQVLATVAVNPDHAPQQTLDGRRKRLKEKVKPGLAEIGWTESTQPWRYKHSG